MIERRTFIASGLLLTVPGVAGAAKPVTDFDDLRAKLGRGARLGLAALDLTTGRQITADAEARFSMASTFKLALAGATLAEADARHLSLTDTLEVQPSDLLEYAPVVRAAGAGGRLSIERLCAAIVEVSDNGAANMLLRRYGGPPAVTRFFRRCGDRYSRLDRYEPELNSNLPGDPRDTTTPAAMLRTMRALLVDGPLKPTSRQMLTGWMMRSNRGLDRLRAGLPSNWRAGSKAGTGARGAMNDLVIAWPPGRLPILVACYLDSPNATDDVRAAVHRGVARRVAAVFA